MEQTEEGRRIQQILTKYFADKDEVLFARLFGSMAQGTDSAKSDVDVAVHCKEVLSGEQLVALQQDLECLCNREIDLCDLRRAEGLFLYKIMTKGCQLKHKSEIHHYYVMKALNFYEDYYPLVQRIQVERLRRFCNG